MISFFPSTFTSPCIDFYYIMLVLKTKILKVSIFFGLLNIYIIFVSLDTTTDYPFTFMMATQNWLISLYFAVTLLFIRFLLWMFLYGGGIITSTNVTSLLLFLTTFSLWNTEEGVSSRSLFFLDVFLWAIFPIALIYSTKSIFTTTFSCAIVIFTLYFSVLLYN